MFENSNCNLFSKIIKERDGISYEFKYCIEMSFDEKKKLKEFREEFAKTSPIHFNFDEQNFQFSQKKYFKINQFITDPPKLKDLESKFINDIKLTITQFNNFLEFEKIENLEKKENIGISKILGNNTEA
ncbi:MAG: hypothetical protein IPM32_15175 [Ignavibacteriae bacterium]|nr:hypothetical protein [Ignavibacteriota bacterium]